MCISDWSSDVCSSDLIVDEIVGNLHRLPRADRIYIKRVRCGNARGAERGDVADPAIISLRGENARATGQAVGDIELRSAERRVGKECGSTCRSRGSRYY